MVVTEVELGSFAEDLGLVEGDIIVSVNRRPVAKVSELRTIREGLKPGDDIALKVMRRAINGWTAQYLGGVLPDGDSGRFGRARNRLRCNTVSLNAGRSA
ncbi:MAG: PDZ domain-containing protein [Bryobacterales bacterium]